VELRVWAALLALCVAGGLMPGPAVMLVTTSAMRYGARASMLAAVGICTSNLIWAALAVSGAAALAHAFPAAFLALKLVGVGYVVLLAWRIARSAPVDLVRREPPPRARLYGRGVGLQLANPNALVFFGGLLPAYIDADRSLVVQAAAIMATVTSTELFGLGVYAGAAQWLARRFASRTFATWFFRGAALTMASSALFAVWRTLGR
jgi:homoserine/homoserine lactone efflux protein